MKTKLPFSVAISTAVFLVLMTMQGTMQAQTAVETKVITGVAAKGAPLPEYLIYRHFLRWIAALDTGAKKNVTYDLYAFAKPVSEMNLANADLDVLRVRALTLKTELDLQDAKALVYINAYRTRARAAAALGQKLPGPPTELKQLEAGKMAISIRHYVELQHKMSPEGLKSLRAYVANGFAPNVSWEGAGIPTRQSDTQAKSAFTSTLK